MRERWEKFANERLAAYGLDVRIDVRSLQGQGIDRVPTTHLGVAVWGMERRGVETPGWGCVCGNSKPRPLGALQRPGACPRCARNCRHTRLSVGTPAS